MLPAHPQWCRPSATMREGAQELPPSKKNRKRDSWRGPFGNHAASIAEQGGILQSFRLELPALCRRQVVAMVSCMKKEKNQREGVEPSSDTVI